MYCLAPSVYAADIMQLEQQLRVMERAGVSCIHVDIMDGSFVPNLSFGPDFVKDLRGYTDMKLDVHLMVDEPARFIKAFAEVGSDVITVHFEAGRHPRSGKGSGNRAETGNRIGEDTAGCLE